MEELKEEHYKILGLKTDGFRKLTAFEMTFAESGLTQIRGKNKQGKSSAIKVIEWLIKGNKVLNKDIIQHGKDKASAQMMLGDYSIKRVATLKTQTLEVRNTKTNVIMKGEIQNFLFTMINEITFNSKSFLDKSPTEQLKFCFDLFGIDFTDVNKELLTIEQDRLICGRERDKFGDLDGSKPEKVSRIDIDSLMRMRKEIEIENEVLRNHYQTVKDQTITDIEAFNKEQRAKTNKLLEAKTLIDEDKKDIDECNEEIAELELKLKNAKSALLEFKASLDRHETHLKSLSQPLPEKPLVADIPTPEFKSTDEIDAKIQNATAINQKAELYDQWEAKKKGRAVKDIEYQELTSKITALRKKKIDMLLSIKTGVKGLEIREDGLYYNNTYSENWSDMESIKIASELCLAQNPKLRAIFIDRFESFDKANREEFNEWAKQHNVQVVVTIVDDNIPETIDEDNVIYIEEGKIVETK